MFGVSEQVSGLQVLTAEKVHSTVGGNLVPNGIMPLSALYVRRNKPPTRSMYDVSISAPTSSLSTSPCNVDDVRAP